MLVLSRKLNEQIFIGHDIVLTIVEIDRGRVRIGLEAPASVNIARAELGKPACRHCHGAGCEKCK